MAYTGHAFSLYSALQGEIFLDRNYCSYSKGVGAKEQLLLEDITADRSNF